MRFLFASTHSYPPQRAGGIESSTHNLCEALLERGHEVAVMASLESSGSVALWNRVRRKLLFGPRFPSDSRMGYPVYRGWNPVEGAEEVLRDFEPSVVVIQGRYPVPLASGFVALGVPSILYLRDVEFHELGGEIAQGDGLSVIANSRFTAGQARTRLGIEAPTLPPLVRPEAYRTASTREKVVFVNPHPVKGVEIAFALAEARPDIPFLFLESWKLRRELEDELRGRAARLENVEWRSRAQDMRGIYGEARLLLVPSRWEEAWGRVPTEGQVSGIPVLASNRGGLPESVGPGGILVDPEAPSATWVQALSRIWDDPEEYERLSEAAWAHSQREEIQPGYLVSRLVELAEEGITDGVSR